MPGLERASIELVDQWKSECSECSTKHAKLSIHFKHKYLFFGLVQLLLPISFGLINQINGTASPTTDINSVGFALSAVTTILLNFLSFKAKSVSHDKASNAYATLENDIEAVMVQHRVPPDTLIIKIKNELKNLQGYSPGLDDGCCCLPS